MSRCAFISTREGHLRQTGIFPMKQLFLSVGYRVKGGWRASRWLLQYPSLSCADTRDNLPGNTPEEKNPNMETRSLSRERGQFNLNSSKTCCIFIVLHLLSGERMLGACNLLGATESFSLYSSIMKLLKARYPNKESVLICLNQVDELDYLPSDWILEVYIIMTAINWKKNYGKCLNDRESHMWKDEQ